MEAIWKADGVTKSQEGNLLTIDSVRKVEDLGIRATLDISSADQCAANFGEVRDFRDRSALFCQRMTQRIRSQMWMSTSAHETERTLADHWVHWITSMVWEMN